MGLARLSPHLNNCGSIGLTDFTLIRRVGYVPRNIRRQYSIVNGNILFFKKKTEKNKKLAN
tara:strand:+ start:321 stop:503 length:183 start_codon:yes stop_codon:yes gene_type:complete